MGCNTSIMIKESRDDKGIGIHSVGLSRYLMGLPGKDLVGFLVFLIFANLYVSL